MTLDLKTPEGVEIVKRMVASADVLIENFRTGTMESFGLGYDTLSAINPRLVYCSVSAFGRTGPRKDGAGYEALMQAFSGIMSITGEPGGAPVRCRRVVPRSHHRDLLRLRHRQRAAAPRAHRAAASAWTARCWRPR